MGDTNKVTLGNGTLYLNGVDVGFLKGDVEVTYAREQVEFKPSNEMGTVKIFTVSERAELKASVAELKCANLKLAMGLAESVSASQSFPAYEGAPDSSYTSPDSASYDVLTFGGKKTLDELPLRFVHTRDDGKDVVVVFYNAIAAPDITIPFSEADVCMHDLLFKALHVTTRAAGDQIGFIAEQVQGS